MGRPFPFDCSSQASQLSQSSVDAGLIVQVKPASQLSKFSVDAGLIVQVKPASSASLQSTLD